MDNDGQWEPELEDSICFTRRGGSPGKHVFTLSVTDSSFNETVVKDSIMVFEGEHETGIVIDKRPLYPEYYGTVKIGEQWRM